MRDPAREWITCDQCCGRGRDGEPDILDGFQSICDHCNGRGGWYFDEDDPDLDDGQPDEAKEWEDYDRDC